MNSYLSLLSDETTNAEWMAAGLGVDITPFISIAVDHSGHVRVELEDTLLGSDRTNVEWTEHARSEIKTVVEHLQLQPRYAPRSKSSPSDSLSLTAALDAHMDVEIEIHALAMDDSMSHARRTWRRI